MNDTSALRPKDNFIPNFWKISALSLFSLVFLLLPHRASADTKVSLTVDNPDITNIVQNYLTAGSPDSDQKLDINIPDNISADLRSLPGQTPRPQFLPSFGDSLNTYLNHTPTDPVSNDYKTAAAFVSSQILPSLTKVQAADAVWEEKDGKVTNFNPGTNGLSYDPLNLITSLAQAVSQNQTTLTVKPVVLVAEHNLAEINSYSIKALIGRGTSDFSNSSKARIKNITLGASKVGGVIIPAGQTFSFNQWLGPVDGEHGFAPELVIKKTGVVPEFGGGLCQVSSTVFRAALNTGLPITERRNHSFAVNHYAPQGTDATIYPGVQDLKFTNDTTGNIMIWPTISGHILTFDIYGTPDSRQVTVDQPVRYDNKGGGDFKTLLKRTVVYADGKTENNDFRSHYLPQSLFEETTTATEPVPATPTTPTPPTTTSTPPTT